MNNICKTQNSEDCIRFLKAQRRLYSIAKRFSFANFAVSVLFVVVSAVIAAFITGFSVWYAYISLLALLIGQILKFFSDTYKEKAAQVQSRFDSAVLEVDTNDFFLTPKVTLEEIKHHADRISKNDNKGLEDWYPQAVAELPVAQARIICQRANCYWNFTQRKRYIILLVLSTVLAALTVIGLGLTVDVTVSDILLYVIFPTLPILNWGLTEVIAHYKSLTMLEYLRDRFEDIIYRLQANNINNEELTLKSIQLQDVIYIIRSNAPLVPGFLYWLLRTEQEDGMQFSAEQILRKINNRT